MGSSLRRGFGLSTFQKNRGFLDWPTDVADAADLLGIDRFAVLAVSAAKYGGRKHGKSVSVRFECMVGPTRSVEASRTVGWCLAGRPEPISGFDLGDLTSACPNVC